METEVMACCENNYLILIYLIKSNISPIREILAYGKFIFIYLSYHIYKVPNCLKKKKTHIKRCYPVGKMAKKAV